MKRIGRYISPKKIGLGYAMFAITTSVGFAISEGSFYKEEIINYMGQSYVVHPLIDNYATLLDFALLNPLMIFLLFRSVKRGSDILKSKPVKYQISPYHKIGLSGIAVLLTAGFMYYYYHGFSEGLYFDAVMRPYETTPTLTKTGWVVFFWTSTCMFITLQFSALQIPYLKFLLSLESEDMVYNPQHEDSVAGQKHLIKPIMDYFYAALVMLIIFILFQQYDSTYLTTGESNRLNGFMVFIIIAGPVLILPTLHLNKLMSFHRNLYLQTMRIRMSGIYSEFKSEKPKNSVSIDEEIKKLDYVDRYQKLIKGLPTWPLPRMELTLPAISLVGAFIKVTTDIIQIF